VEKTIIHKRKTFSPRATLGEVFIEDKHFCYTLEDIVRKAGEKTYGKTAIPDMEYYVDITYSPKYKRDMIILYNAENYTVTDGVATWSGIRVHGGNNVEDTLGCVLVGYNKYKETIYKRADRELVKIVKKWINRGYKVNWRITNEEI